MTNVFHGQFHAAHERSWLCLSAWAGMVLCLVSAAEAAEIQLLRAKPDPYGYPRPTPGEVDVPTATSFFIQIGFKDTSTSDTVMPESVAVQICAKNGAPVDMLKPGRRFVNGYSGKLLTVSNRKPALVVYLDGSVELEPLTTYTVSVQARSREGAVLEGPKGSWQFTTGPKAIRRSLEFRLDLSSDPVRWHGGFFIGFCKPSFCTSAANRIPGYELMDRIRKDRKPASKAWSLQRDFTLTGMEHQPRFLSGGLPNVVRERETRRIVDIQEQEDGMLLRVEDFFGHEQYGIPTGRPLVDDYHPGDVVLIADGVHDAQAKVVAIVEDSSSTRSLLVTSFPEPDGGWRIAYARPLPKNEDPNAPGLFPPGGCYLRKFRPAGTPHFYWGRVDREWDIAQRRFGRRLVVNFTDAPGDLSVDGRTFTFPKDYVEYHAVVHAFTSHLIERYGEACLGFVWSVFNEPDLTTLFWRSRDWNELQKFYDYTVDAILRAFEDHGYDSNRVVVGGLEIGAIFGTHIEGPILKIFLSHCSPTASCEGALPRNAAFADRRLDGKRSRRVETLCRSANGKGSPCDFISVHSYNASAMTAAKLIRAKELALQIDADYYAGLWVDCFESCPGWAPPPDVAAADSYLGNGYFPTWCADVARRLLAKAAEDPRYGFGASLITFWPWPNSNFGGHNNATRVIAFDDNGDGRKDRETVIAMPILNFLGLMARMENTYRVLPEQTVGPHVLSGFASGDDRTLRILLYAHNARDTQSRGKADFCVTLKLDSVPWPKVRLTEYRFDADHNSYFHAARRLRDRPATGSTLRPDQVDRLIADLTSGDRARQLAAIREASSFGRLPDAMAAAALQLYQKTQDADVRAAIVTAARKTQSRNTCYSAQEIARIQELARLNETATHNLDVQANGELAFTVPLAGNGASILVIQPGD